MVLYLLRLFLQLYHLYIYFPPIPSVAFPPLIGKLPFQPQLPCRKVPEPYDTPDNAKDHATSDQDPKTISSNTAAALAGVEKGVWVEALRGMGDVGQSEIARQQDDQKDHVQRRRWTDPWQHDLEEGEQAVEGMLGYL